MSDGVLYTYNKKHFLKYKQEREGENINLITLALVELKQNSLEDILGFNEIDIDITSIVQVLEKGNLYLVEKLIYILNNFEHINYIIDERHANLALESLGIFFNQTESVTSGYEDENIKENKSKTKGTDKKVRTLTSIGKNKIDQLEDYLNTNLIGHEKFKKNLIKQIHLFRFFNKTMKDHPILSVFLLGDSGVGKTELARILHSFLGNNKTPLAKINFANYKNESSLASLIGSPPGYINSGTESDFIKKVRKSKIGVILVDEFEKADAAVHNFFLQLLEEGQFDDAMGEVHNLNGYIIIFTSNLNANEFTDKLPAELRSRFDIVTHFDNLNLEEKRLYVERIVEHYSKKALRELTAEEIEVIISNSDLEKESNLRNIKRKVRDSFYYIIKK